MTEVYKPALKSLDLDGIAELISFGKCKQIAFLTGAGVSVSAGIPDFRSPGGMYDTLKPDLLTATEKQRQLMRVDPTAVVSWPLFKDNQLCYLELRRPFILGIAEKRWKATLTHFFIQVCHNKGLLRRLYTQNIDGMDYQTDVPHDKIVGVHGTMGKIGCEFCKKDFEDYDQFRELVRKNIKDIYKQDETAPEESTPIPCPHCQKNGLKPKTVLYGSALPKSFFEKTDEDFEDSDDVGLLIVAGTSLTVGPANSVVNLVDVNCPRLIANKEPVGKELGIKYGESVDNDRDVFSGLSCDETFLILAEKLGWLEDLAKYKDRMSDQSVDLLKKKLGEN